MTQPCRPDCPDRSSTCHASCPKQKAWEAYKKPIYAARALANEIYTSTEHWENYARKVRRG